MMPPPVVPPALMTMPPDPGAPCLQTGGLVVKGIGAAHYKSFTIDDSAWPPRFCKIELKLEDGTQVRFALLGSMPPICPAAGRGLGSGACACTWHGPSPVPPPHPIPPGRWHSATRAALPRYALRPAALHCALC